MKLIMIMKWPYQHKDDPLSLWNAPLTEINHWYDLYNEIKPKENPLEKF